MRKQNFIWVILIVLLPILACGLPGSDRGSDAAPAAPSPAPDTPVAAESAATEPADAAAPAQSEDTAPTESTQSGASEEPQESMEPQSTEFTGITGLDQLSSYRVDFMMSFDGQSGDQPANGQVKMTLEEAKNQPARHLTMEMSGTMAEQTGGMNALEVYYIDDKVYMKNAAMGDDSWISFSGDEATAFEQGFFAPDEQLELPNTADCDSQPVTVNGISTTHCTFTEKDISSDEAAFDSVQGEVWVATEGNYIVKLIFNAEGYRTIQKSEDDVFDFGSVSFDYNVTDINSDFTITLPEEATQAMDMGAAGGAEPGGETMPAESGDIPVFSDAQDVVNLGAFVTYSTPAAIADIVSFYRQELAAAGWQENSEEAYTDESTAILSFTTEGKTFHLTVTTQDDKRSVMAAVE